MEHELYIEFEAKMTQTVKASEDGDIISVDEPEVTEFTDSIHVFCNCTPDRALVSDDELAAHGLAPDWQFQW